MLAGDVYHVILEPVGHKGTDIAAKSEADLWLIARHLLDGLKTLHMVRSKRACLS
jgi:hypothetical protein